VVRLLDCSPLVGVMLRMNGRRCGEIPSSDFGQGLTDSRTNQDSAAARVAARERWPGEFLGARLPTVRIASPVERRPPCAPVARPRRNSWRPLVTDCRCRHHSKTSRAVIK
jgi:hypothetical protein